MEDLITRKRSQVCSGHHRSRSHILQYVYNLSCSEAVQTKNCTDWSLFYWSLEQSAKMGHPRALAALAWMRVHPIASQPFSLSSACTCLTLSVTACDPVGAVFAWFLSERHPVFRVRFSEHIRDLYLSSPTETLALLRAESGTDPWAAHALALALKHCYTDLVASAPEQVLLQEHCNERPQQPQCKGKQQEKGRKKETEAPTQLWALWAQRGFFVAAQEFSLWLTQ